MSRWFRRFQLIVQKKKKEPIASVSFFDDKRNFNLFQLSSIKPEKHESIFSDNKERILGDLSSYPPSNSLVPFLNLERNVWKEMPSEKFPRQSAAPARKPLTLPHLDIGSIQRRKQKAEAEVLLVASEEWLLITDRVIRDLVKTSWNGRRKGKKPNHPFSVEERLLLPTRIERIASRVERGNRLPERDRDLGADPFCSWRAFCFRITSLWSIRVYLQQLHDRQWKRVATRRGGEGLQAQTGARQLKPGLGCLLICERFCWFRINYRVKLLFAFNSYSCRC